MLLLLVLPGLVCRFIWLPQPCTPFYPHCLDLGRQVFEGGKGGQVTQPGVTFERQLVQLGAVLREVVETVPLYTHVC